MDWKVKFNFLIFHVVFILYYNFIRLQFNTLYFSRLLLITPTLTLNPFHFIHSVLRLELHLTPSFLNYHPWPVLTRCNVCVSCFLLPLFVWIILLFVTVFLSKIIFKQFLSLISFHIVKFLSIPLCHVCNLFCWFHFLVATLPQSEHIFDYFLNQNTFSTISIAIYVLLHILLLLLFVFMFVIIDPVRYTERIQFLWGTRFF